MNAIRHPHLKIKICVSGAAETGHCGIDALEKGKELGKEIARQGAILVTGATTGFPLWAAMGIKEEGGISLGISPAQTEKEHVEAYKLPLEYMDLIMYTGSGYSGRNLQLTRTSDAVLVGCGRIGTLNEFTIAFEDNKPIGILEGDWPTDELIKKILAESFRENNRIVFDKDPKKLVEKVIELVKKDKVEAIKCPGCI
ncbi:hypothetical protein C4572_02680 [Candidatus Parcubacteria bacterium]|nr:MAG: hypothetical protein C4572_02680 [Candidatus Parcubacteria bacterium]